MRAQMYPRNRGFAGSVSLRDVCNQSYRHPISAQSLQPSESALYCDYHNSMGRGRKRYPSTGSVGHDGRSVAKRRKRTGGGWISSMGGEDVMQYFRVQNTRGREELGRNRELDPVIRNDGNKRVNEEREELVSSGLVEDNNRGEEGVNEENPPGDGTKDPMNSEFHIVDELQTFALDECSLDAEDAEVPLPDQADNEERNFLMEADEEFEEDGHRQDSSSSDGSEAEEQERNSSAGVVVKRRPNFRMLRRAKSRMCHWTRIVALITVCGSVRFTVKQYMFIRSFTHWVSGEISLPSYSAVQRTLFPKALQFLFPGSNIVRVRKKCRRGMVDPSQLSDNGEVGRDLCPLRIVPPSSWAKMDVVTFPFFLDIFGEKGMELCDASSVITSQPRGWEGRNGMSDITRETEAASDCSIERSQVVMERSSVTDPTRCIYVKDGDRKKRARSGDRLFFPVRDIPSHLGEVRSRKGLYGFRRSVRGTLMFYGTIRNVWCVGYHGIPTESGMDAVREAPEHEKDLIKSITTARALVQSESRNRRDLRSATHTFGRNRKDDIRVVPGDICVSFCQEELQRPEYVPVLVMRFWKNQDGIPSERLLWYSVTDSVVEEQNRQSGSTCTANAQAHTCFKDISATAKQSVLELPRICRNERERDNSFSSRNLSNLGRLADGTRYVVYRVLLYCDDFRPFSTLYPQGSAGGCYLLPLGISPSKRNCRSAVHILSLTPPGVSTNEVLIAVIPDIVKATTEGVDGFLPNGVPVKIFIDVVGFIGDYPAAAHTIDVIGHIANAPCTLCTFIRSKGTDGSECGYTTEVNVSSSAWVRCADRHSALRSSNIPDPDANRLGMKTCEDAAAQPSPLFILQEELKKAKSKIPLTEEGKPVVSGIFDAYLSNFVAPDHLLTGIAKNIIEVCLQLLGNNETRQEVDVRLCDALRENGLIRQNTILNSKGALNSMSLSSTYCLLLVSGPVFRRFWGIPRSTICEKALELLDVLQELVGLTYWWPTVEVDGIEAVRYVRGKDISFYIGDLQDLSKLYVQKVDDFCRVNRNVGKSLDKPNLHRLIELYQHSVPAFGHVRHFMELVFECAHQPLKRCIARSNHHNAHISAVEHCIGNDWQGRLALLHSLACSNGNEKGTAELALRGLRHLLLGEEADLLDDNVEGDAKFIQECNRCILDSFVEPVKGELAEEGKISPAWIGGQHRWLPRNQMNIEEMNEGSLVPHPSSRDEGGIHAEQNLFSPQQILERIEYILESEQPLFRNTEDKAVTLFSCARRMRERQAFLQSSTAYGHDVISPGSVLQALVGRGEVSDLITAEKGGGSARKLYFAVLGIVRRGEEEPLAAVVRCRTFSSSMLQVPPDATINSVKLLKLENGVRRVGIYHMCVREECKLVGKSVKHSKSLLSGGMHYYQERRNGYPPRMA